MATDQSIVQTGLATGNGPTFFWLGGRGAYILDGTIGAAVDLQVLSRLGNWVTVSTQLAESGSAVGCYQLELPRGHYRFVLGAATSGVTIDVIGITW